MKHSNQHLIPHTPQHFHTRAPIQRDFVNEEQERCLKKLQLAILRKHISDLKVGA